jgi:hypothetical protein
VALALSLEEILVKAPTEAAAFAGGLAIHPALAPLLRDLENFTWSEHPDKALDLMTAAAVAAEDVAAYDAMAQEAKYGGYNGDRFAWAYGETLNAPGVGELLALLRRNSEVQIDFAHGLRKAKLEARWDAALRNLRDLRIPGPDLAYMVVRGVVPDGGTLPSSLPTQADNLSLPPQLNLDTLNEAALTGWDQERFAALVARSGLAMGPVQAANAYFRNILTRNDYELTIARGDLFPAFADPVLEVSRQILSANQYTERQLRGFTDRAGRLADTRKSGMSDEDSDKLYEVLGRAPSVHTLVIGLARGGKYPGSYANIPEPFKAAIQRSNIREEFAELVYAARFGYPSGFQIRSEAQRGDLSEGETEEILLELGWSPKWAAFFAAKWTATTPGSGKELVKSELLAEFEGGFLTESELRDHLTALGYVGANQDLEVHLADARRIKGWRDKGITALGKRYVASTMDQTAADGYLVELGVTDADTRSRIIGIWNIEREFK